MRSMDTEDLASTPSTPPASTPRAPLFLAHLKSENRSSNSTMPPKSSILGRSGKCFTVDTCATEEGSIPAVTCTMTMPPPPTPLAKKVLAEFVGTFILIFAGTATAIVNQKTQGAETLIGLAGSTGLAVMIVILSTGHISGAHLNPSITIAFAALKHFPWAQVRILQVGELAGIAVGATVMLNILIAGPTTGASMNPVRTLGPAIAVHNFKGIWIYLTAPILGALCGAGVYTAVKLPEEDNSFKQPSTVQSFRV